MSFASPRAVVDLIDYAPLKFGLKSVSRPFPSIDPHWRTGGVQFETFTCAQANVWYETCESVGSKMDPPEPTLLEFDPVTIYSDWLCGPIGMTSQERMQKSQIALECSEDREIENFFYESFLTAGSGIAINTDLTPVSIAAGVGFLEGAMSQVQCGEPTIHAPREMGEVAASFRLTYGAGNMLRTAMGSPWAFGSGYGNVGPDGVPPPVGVVWLYATGPMYLAQSEVFMNPPTFADALNRTNNELRWEANRTSLVATNSCVVYAVAVFASGDTTSGGSSGGGSGITYPAP